MLFPDPFLENQNRGYIWINIINFYTVYFIVFQVECYRNILKLGDRPLAFTLYKAFLKRTERGLKLVSLSHFLHDF